MTHGVSLHRWKLLIVSLPRDHVPLKRGLWEVQDFVPVLKEIAKKSNESLPLKIFATDSVPRVSYSSESGSSHSPGEARQIFLTRGNMMKKLFALVLALASIGFVGLGSEAQASEKTHATTVLSASAAPQWIYDRYGRRGYNRRRVRTTRRSRIVRYGRRVYRETYLVRYLRNGRTLDTRLISRVRIA